ncbi:putative reverse transcriptase domain-containing protein [Tanacetum coccineum]
MRRLARLYIDEIVARHVVLVSIISDYDGRFTSRFWQILQKALGTRLDMSMTYHPQTDKQIIIRVFDVLHLKGYMEGNVGHMSFGPEMVQETIDKVVLIKERLKAGRDRQKSYADNRREPIEFEVNNNCY